MPPQKRTTAALVAVLTFATTGCSNQRVARPPANTAAASLDAYITPVNSSNASQRRLSSRGDRIDAAMQGRHAAVIATSDATATGCHPSITVLLDSPRVGASYHLRGGEVVYEEHCRGEEHYRSWSSTHGSLKIHSIDANGHVSFTLHDAVMQPTAGPNLARGTLRIAGQAQRVRLPVL